MRKQYESLVGTAYGELTVIEDGCVGARRKLVCQCSCGGSKAVRLDALQQGITRSCGCLIRKATRERCKSHGLSNSPIYRSWQAMLSRCRNPNSHGYEFYGGRGLSVCAGLGVFENFRDVLGPRPDGKTLDRVDPARGYDCGRCPECRAKGSSCNVRWATQHEQSFNKTSTIRIELDGIVLTTEEAAEKTGVPADTIRQRVGLGWDPVRAATTPVHNWSKREQDTLIENEIWKRLRRKSLLCERTRDDFEAFLTVFGRRPDESYSFRRDDSSTGFWCSDCEECRRHDRSQNARWVPSGQRKKRRPNRVRKDVCVEQPLAV